MTTRVQWFLFAALSAAAHGGVLFGLSWAARDPRARPPSPNVVRFGVVNAVPTSPTVDDLPPAHRAAVPPHLAPSPASLLDRAGAAEADSLGVMPIAATPILVAVGDADAVLTGPAGSGLAAGPQGGADDATGNGAASVSALAGGEGTAGCWLTIRKEFLQRMQKRVPRAIADRGLVGEVTVRLWLDASGRTQKVEFDDLKGSALVIEALRAILEQPFAHGCDGEGRWPARFRQRRG
jgi:hypothetical protein